MKLKLVGAKRYNIDGELYLSHEPDGRTEIVYIVDEKKGKYLLDQYDSQSGYAYFDEYTGTAEGRAPGKVEDIDRAPRRERGANERRRRPGAEAAPSERTHRPSRSGPRNPDISLRTSPGGQGQRVRQSRPIEEDPVPATGTAGAVTV